MYCVQLNRESKAYGYSIIFGQFKLSLCEYNTEIHKNTQLRCSWNNTAFTIFRAWYYNDSILCKNKLAKTTTEKMARNPGHNLFYFHVSFTYYFDGSMAYTV